MNEPPAYGLWSLVLINAAIFIIFAFSFAKPEHARQALLRRLLRLHRRPVRGDVWVSADHQLAVRLAYQQVSGRELVRPRLGPPLGDDLRLEIEPPFRPVPPAEHRVDLQRFLAALGRLYAAQRAHRLATAGPYARVRHPQYAGFVLIMFGFLLQWPTLVTLVMFPILVFMCVRLARREEREVPAEFGAAYERYRAATPAFFPSLGGAGAAEGRRP